jgi:hypothetical protein
VREEQRLFFTFGDLPQLFRLNDVSIQTGLFQAAAVMPPIPPPTIRMVWLVAIEVVTRTSFGMCRAVEANYKASVHHQYFNV